MRYFRVSPGVSLCSLLLPLSICAQTQNIEPPPVSFITRIDNLDAERRYVSSDRELLGIIEFSEFIPCGDKKEKTAYVLQKNNQLDEQGLINKLRELNEKLALYYKVTLDNCDVTTLKLKNIQPCNAGNCPDKYILSNKIWLSNEYKISNDLNRTGYFIQLPLKQDSQNKLWKVEGLYAGSILDEPVSDKKPELAFIAQTDDSEFKTQKFVGEFTKYYPNGEVSVKKYYNDDGQVNGKFMAYYQGGKPYQEANYVDGKEEGKIITYHKNGKIESEVTYHDGKAEDGLCIHYFDDGTVSRRHTYQDGQYNGEVLEYYSNGKVSQKQRYNKGDLEESMSYRQDGTKQQYNAYKNKVQRAYKLWYENDQLNVDWHWNEEHKPIGEQKEWYENGHYREVKVYDDQNVLQKQTSWYENGQKMIESLYQNGKLKERASWDEDGKLAYRYEYDENGQKIKKSN